MPKKHSRCPTNLHGQTNRRIEPSQHVDDASVLSPLEEIADARLRYTQGSGCSLLFEAASHDELLYLDHEIRPDQQVFGLLTAKSHITEDIPSGCCNIRLHTAHSF